ncbi:PAS domain S-box [Rhodococcus opacus M213]|uniref:PAS domain-containing protein n=2 Tax=Rhodococcus opacus TaxID=37919 RepID=A0AAX3YUN1_RHOOP|nr:PAS domain-containing protein [Rhodococcus opacus]EKT77616.1 PAS domain S-box [Rhodococcus opacus M213]MCZ4590553.1 PAS domain-containing protein [Rhodococcus opacus]WLF52245.1 PAS domain-containing protein [Rhodococcus opacus]
MSDTQVEIPGSIYQAFFEKMPVIAFVVDKERRIVAVTDRLLGGGSNSREALVGKDVFEMFPDNPDDPQANGTEVLRASLDRAFLTGEIEVLPRQRYDARAEDGQFVERYWLPENNPVRDADGHVAFVIHSVVDANTVGQ